MTVLSAATRRLTVQYGSFTLDETNGITLDSSDRSLYVREGYVDGDFSCEFELRLTTITDVAATDDAAFATLVRACEEALRKPRQKLQVKLGTFALIGGTGATMWDPTSGVKSAFLVQPTLEKVGDPNDTGRFRRYRFSVHVQFPADLTGQGLRQDSSTQTFTTITGRRVCVITGVWTASSAGLALANYNTNAASFFSGQLPTPVTSGEWIEVAEDPVYDDENSILRVTRTYWEVVNGLREYQVEVDRGPNQARVVVLSGFYTFTAAATAIANYTANVGSLASSVLAAVGVTNYEGTSVPKVTGYDQNTQRYFFRHTYKELIAQQSASGYDDPNVADYVLHVRHDVPYGPQTIAGTRINRLESAHAEYVAVIDSTQSTDPQGLWASGLRAFVVDQIQSRLGAISVAIEREVVDVSPDANPLTASLDCIVKNGTVLQFFLREKVRRTGSFNFRPRADGKPHSYWPYKQPPSKTLSRAAFIEYLAGTPEPTPFVSGQPASGFDLVDTGLTYQQSLDQQEQGILPPGPGWVCLDGDADRVPTTRGEHDDLATMGLTQAEDWLYFSEMGPVAAAPSGTIG